MTGILTFIAPTETRASSKISNIPLSRSAKIERLSIAQETAGAAQWGAGKQDSPALSKLVTGHNDTSPHQCEDERGEEERGEKKKPFTQIWSLSWAGGGSALTGLTTKAKLNN